VWKEVIKVPMKEAQHSRELPEAAVHVQDKN